MKVEKSTYRDCSLVHGAPTVGKEDVHQDSHHERGQVHAHGRTNEQTTPQARVAILDLLQTQLRPRMRKINQENQSEEKEEHGAEEGNVVAVNEEEGLGNKEGHDDKSQPEDDLRTPITILYSGAGIFRALNSEQKKGEYQVEETESEVDPMHRNPAMTFLPVASNLHIIEGQVLQFLQSPWREHDP